MYGTDLFQLRKCLYEQIIIKLSDMDLFDNEGNIKSILEGIQKADTFYNAFKEEFSEAVFGIIRGFYPEAGRNEEIENLLLLYAVAILNSTESVIDKDHNYPYYRLEEDLGAMNKIITRFDNSTRSNGMDKAIHEKAKELVVKHFDAVFELSGIGFRLLERNARLYNLEFVVNLEKTLTPEGIGQ